VIPMDMQKLIITATTANSWIYPDLKNWATTTEDLIEDAVRCAEAGASILHIHLPPGDEKEVVDRVRERTDAIIQCGMSSFPINERDAHFDCHPDLISCIANHHDEHFPQGNMNVIHTVEELEAYCIKCREYGIKPEWEVWHTGSFWNLQWLLDKELLDIPAVITLFFNWPGGTWSPATPDELLHRVKYIPPNCAYSVSVMGENQVKLETLSISIGGNIRVGTEDWPFTETGAPAKDNGEIVARWVRIAKDMGREVADPSEARQMLGLK